MSQRVYYLPGRGGHLNQGLGAALQSKGLQIVGSELPGGADAGGFATHVDAVAADLQREHWHRESLVLANSFGAYLLLHALAQLPLFVGNVLLLSPILGMVFRKDAPGGFVPPRARKILAMVEAGTFPVPRRCEIHVGSQDWQSDPERALAIGLKIGAKVNVVPDQGHILERGYVLAVIDSWIDESMSIL